MAARHIGLLVGAARCWPAFSCPGGHEREAFIVAGLVV